MKKYSIEPYDNPKTNTDFKKEEAYLRAKKKVDAIVGFYWHAVSYVVVNIFLIVLIGINSSEGFSTFGTYATAFFWGIGLLFHFLGVFGSDFLFGKNWEKSKIEKYMKNEEQHWE